MTILPQRPLRGSRISTFYPIKNLPSLSSLDSAFQLQEYISLLIRLDVHDVEAIVTLPGKVTGKEKEKDGEGMKEWDKDKDKDDEMPTIDSEDGEDRSKSDATVDEACWIYEQLRRLAQDLTHPLITMLQQECTRSSCPEMKAGEWLYLCVAHGNDGATEQCCAIDYILHTLDSATALLNTPRAFPSRIQIPSSSHRHFSSLARRLGRIFAHAYFHHREAFEQAEAESSLYARFLALTSKFELVPPEFLVIPPRMEGVDERVGVERERGFDYQTPRVLSASLDPRTFHERQQRTMPMQSVGQEPWDRRASVAMAPERPKSKSPPGLKGGNGSESPRKMGRNRTDTMVLHEPFAGLEELKVETEERGRPLLDNSVQEMEADIVALSSTSIPNIELQEDLPSITDGFDSTKSHTSLPEEYQHTGDSLPESPIIKSPTASHAPTLPPTTEVAASATEIQFTEDEPAKATNSASPDVEAEVAQAPKASDEVQAALQEELPGEADIAEEVTAATQPITPNATAEPVEEPTEQPQEEKETEPVQSVDTLEEEAPRVHTPPSEEDVTAMIPATDETVDKSDAEPSSVEQHIPPTSVDPTDVGQAVDKHEDVKAELDKAELVELEPEEKSPDTKTSDTPNDAQQEKTETAEPPAQEQGQVNAISDPAPV